MRAQEFKRSLLLLQARCVGSVSGLPITQAATGGAQPPARFVQILVSGSILHAKLAD
jgi:hypothetical protein